MKRASIALLLSLIVVTTAAAATRRRAVSMTTPTFNREVVRILQQNCQTCHRPGGGAPFSLLDYDSAAARALQIASKTARREMPPWKPSEGCGEFVGERRLSSSDIATLVAWAQAGAPEGNAEDLPPPAFFKDEDWPMGQPDAIFSIGSIYQPPGHGDTFRVFVLPTGYTDERYLSAIQIHPTAKQSVHHVLAYVDTSGKAEALDQADPLPGYDESVAGLGFDPAGVLGIWAPGETPHRFPDGVAVPLPANARIVLETHYHPHEEFVEPDQIGIGLYFAPDPIEKKIQYGQVISFDLNMPAGESHFRAGAVTKFDKPVEIYSMAAHMHYRGKEMTVRAAYPDGSESCALQVSDWDPRWQGVYAYKTPLLLPAGSELRMEAWFDNSAENPRNPFNPPKDAHHGPLATDEMCFAYFWYAEVGTR